MGSAIKIKRNDGKTYSLKVRDKAGDLIDCTGWTIRFTVRDELPATAIVDDTDAIISKTITGEASGIHSLIILKTDTQIDPKVYHYDVQYERPDGIPHSSDTGKFTIEADITRNGGS